MKRSFSLIFSVLLCELAGIIGSLFTAPAIPVWYASLERPSFAPPEWVFGPVWTTLFALMGIALFLVWEQARHQKKGKVAIGAFVVQLLLNTFWSVLFFGFRSPGAAFGEIFFLWAAIAVTIVAFARISKTAAWLLVPYLLWVSFAAYLNYAIWILN